MSARETLSAVLALWLQSRDDTCHRQTAAGGAAAGDRVGFPWEAVAVLAACRVEGLQLGMWGGDLIMNGEMSCLVVN